jgi:acyl-CoA synthetase (AMP-forming)/AMP-acid ligase II
MVSASYPRAASTSSVCSPSSGAPVMTYGALAAMVDGVATHLKEMGLPPADPVALVCPNLTEFVVGLLGVARVGLVVAPMDPALPGPELSERLEEVGARVVLAEHPLGPQDESLTFRRETPVAVAPVDQPDVQFPLELRDRGRRRGLRDVAGLRRTREVLLGGDRHEVLQLTEQHVRPFW